MVDLLFFMSSLNSLLLLKRMHTIPVCSAWYQCPFVRTPLHPPAMLSAVVGISGDP